MHLLKITYVGTVRHVRSVPGTGEVETVAQVPTNRTSFVVIAHRYMAQRAVDAFASDHKTDEAFEIKHWEVVEEVYGVYRGFERRL